MRFLEVVVVAVDGNGNVTVLELIVELLLVVVVDIGCIDRLNVIQDLLAQLGVELELELVQWQVLELELEQNYLVEIDVDVVVVVLQLG